MEFYIDDKGNCHENQKSNSNWISNIITGFIVIAVGVALLPRIARRV